MKKLLLIGAVALSLVACEKREEPPAPTTGVEQPQVCGTSEAPCPKD